MFFRKILHLTLCSYHIDAEYLNRQWVLRITSVWKPHRPLLLCLCSELCFPRNSNIWLELNFTFTFTFQREMCKFYYLFRVEIILSFSKNRTFFFFFFFLLCKNPVCFARSKFKVINLLLILKTLSGFCTFPCLHFRAVLKINKNFFLYKFILIGSTVFLHVCSDTSYISYPMCLNNYMNAKISKEPTFM